MNFQAVRERWNAIYAGIASFLIAVRCLLRGLPLLVSERPKTPLRILCIAAFDTLHMLRNAGPLPALDLGTLAALLDFGACVNAAFDNKGCCPHEFRLTLKSLEKAGIRAAVVEYVRRLKGLESRRPAPGGDDRQFQKVRRYREAVVRLSLAMAAATANVYQSLDEGIHATYRDPHLHILFRIVMLCQIIDDVLDFSTDLSAGLPSFLTACASPPQALALTRMAMLDYGDNRDLPKTGDVLPLRAALFLVATCTTIVVVLRSWVTRPLRQLRCRSLMIAKSVTDMDKAIEETSRWQPNARSWRRRSTSTWRA
jgi:hypothetical protein